MNIDILSITNNFIEIAKIFLNSSFFGVVKFFIAIYVTVLFVDLVLLLIVRGLGGNIRTALSGTDMPTTSKKKIQKRWMEIENRLKSNEESQYKLAILEADGFVNEVLSGIGYKGKNMTEKLEEVTEEQLDDAQVIREAHKTRNEIINNINFFIDREHTQETINIYKRFLENLEMM